MEIIRFDNAPHYTAPDHQEVVARRLQGGEASKADFALVGHSTFAARAKIPMSAAPIGRVYVVTEGAITVEQSDGVRHTLRPGDSIFIPSGEPRAVANEGDTSAAMIVITPAPPQ